MSRESLSVSCCVQYCMPTDSPHLARQLKPLAIAMSPLLWSRFKPDRFDSYSCGEHKAMLTRRGSND